jgi:hypothetical protein
MNFLQGAARQEKTTMAYRTLCTGGRISFIFALLGVATASAATSFSNSLQGFTGDSTLAGTQAAALAAGFDFFSTTGFNDNGTPADMGDDSDPTVVLDASGVHFGSLFAGDGGRNYMRTTQADFATSDFTAEITFVTPDLKAQDVFFGLGAGDTALFGWPDWSTQFSSVLVLPEITDDDVSRLTTFKTANDVNEFGNFAAPSLLNGTHRVRLEFDSAGFTATFSVDVNYAGGAFVADVTTAPINVSNLFGNRGWPSAEGNFDGQYFLNWQAGFGRGSNATFGEGDADGDGDVDADDFATWKTGFGGEPSKIYFGGDDGVVFKDFSVDVAAAVASAGVVPEPSWVALAGFGLTSLAVAARRKA